MSFSVLLAAAGVVGSSHFTEPLDILQPVRLQLTPTIDGTISKEEWDPFVGQTYLQWEPGKLHFAGQVPQGKDLVLTIDLNGDGWLVGKDNIEARVTLRDGKPVMMVRALDATAVKAPTWMERKDLEAVSVTAAASEGELTTIEATLDDAGIGILPGQPRKLMVRMDVVDALPEEPSYTPRLCTPVQLEMERATALPTGLDWGVAANRRSVVPGESVNLRMNFNSDSPVPAKSIDLRSEGAIQDQANSMTLVFPNFNGKGMASVNYGTAIASDAPMGYRIVRGVVNFKEGPSAVVQASYRVAPVLDFTLRRTYVDELPDNCIIDVPYLVNVYTNGGSAGGVDVKAPEGWEILKGDHSNFKLVGDRKSQERKFQVHVPNDAHGTFPIEMTGSIKGKMVKQTCYITIR